MTINKWLRFAALVGLAVASAWAIAAPKTNSVLVAPTSTATPTPTPRPDQTARVEGRVFDAKTKAPIAGAKVTFSGFNESNNDELETTTDADGRYEFAHLTPEDYAWGASAPGYSERWHGDVDFPVPAKGLKWDIPLVRHAHLAGQVRDAQGRPVVGADVRVYCEEVDDSDDTQTDTNGRFVLNELKVPVRGASALYHVAVSHPRWSDAEKSVRVRAFYSSSDERHLALSLLPRATIVGRLTFRGRPLRHGYAVINGQRGEDLPVASTDAKGRFRQSVSAPAFYTVGFFGENASSEDVPVHVRPGQTLKLNRDLKPIPHGSIQGRLLNWEGQPVRGAFISLLTKNQSDDAPPVATSDKAGRFVARVAPDSRYILSVLLPDAQGNGGTGTKKWSPVRVRLGRTTRVQLRIDNLPPSFELLAPIPRVLNGVVEWRVHARDNVGLSGASLSVDGGQTDFEHQIVDKTFPGAKSPRVGDMTLRWNSRDALNGRHRVHIEVRDTTGNLATRDFVAWVQGSPAPQPTSVPDSAAGVANIAVDPKGSRGY